MRVINEGLPLTTTHSSGRLNQAWIYHDMDLCVFSPSRWVYLIQNIEPDPLLRSEGWDKVCGHTSCKHMFSRSRPLLLAKARFSWLVPMCLLSFSHVDSFGSSFPLGRPPPIHLTQPVKPFIVCNLSWAEAWKRIEFYKVYVLETCEIAYFRQSPIVRNNEQKRMLAKSKFRNRWNPLGLWSSNSSKQFKKQLSSTCLFLKPLGFLVFYHLRWSQTVENHWVFKTHVFLKLWYSLWFCDYGWSKTLENIEFRVGRYFITFVFP